MSRDKQIDEMTKDHFAKVGKKEKEKQIKEMEGIIDKCYPNAKITNNFLAKMLYNAGYRKSEDVAREIFAEADKIFMANCLSLETYKAWCELKKKYTEEGK